MVFGRRCRHHVVMERSEEITTSSYHTLDALCQLNRIVVDVPYSPHRQQ